MFPLLGRWRARRRINHTVALWYHAEYAARCLARTHRTLGVQVDRSEKILETLSKWKLVSPGDVRAPARAALGELILVHTPEYLESIHGPAPLSYVFGMHPTDVDVEDLLYAQRRATGGTIAAAHAVAKGEVQIGMNLGGGFHHAEPAQGGGFCIYNDVAVAIRVLRKDGFLGPIAIIDLDYHQGNGNIVAFADDPSILIYSIDGAVWSDVKAANEAVFKLPPGTNDTDYLNLLRRTLPEALRRHHPEMVFFLAGNDVLKGDSLGLFKLTPEGIAERDQFVVETVRALKTAGLVITMAGGYSEKAWQSTASLVHWLLTDRKKLKKWPAETSVRREFGRIARRLSIKELQMGAEEDEFELTEADILGDLVHHVPLKKILGYYTMQGIETALEKYGILKKLQLRGFNNIELEANLDDEEHQLIRLYGYHTVGEETTRHLIAETILRRTSFIPPSTSGLGPKLEMLGMEWLMLQNPLVPFSQDRRPLPGQKHPGLGMGNEALELFRQVCRRLHLAGGVNKPAYYHNGAVSTALGFYFIDPAIQGKVAAMRKVLGTFSLAEASNLVHSGKLHYGDGSSVTWEPSEQILPVARNLLEYFESPAYSAAASAAEKKWLDSGLHIAL